MKLRIRGSTLRFRLSQTEVKQIGSGEAVIEKTQFQPAVSFVYGLKTSNQIQAVTAHLEVGQIWVTIPTTIANQWASSEKVEMMAEQENGAERKLTILIEKDFACLKTRQNENEDESDLFPNPNEAHGSCN